MKPALIFLFCLIFLDAASQWRKPIITISRKGSECIIDTNNNELIPCGKYADVWVAYDTSFDYYVVTDFKNKKGIYLLGKKEVVPCIYDDIRMFRNHGFVKKGNKMAVLSSNFKVMSDFIFEDAVAFRSDGRSFARVNSKWVIIDTSGRIVKNIPLQKVYHFNEGELYKKAGNGDKYGFIDKNGSIVIPIEYEDVADGVGNDFFPVKKNGKWGYVNKKNKVIVPFQYGFVTRIYEGFGYIRDKNFAFIGYTDSKAKVIFDDKRYVDVEYAREGKLRFAKLDVAGKRKFGYLDSASGQVIIAAQYENADFFYNGHAVVENGGLAAVIDGSGKSTIPFKYERLVKWGHRYLARLKGKYGLVDTAGNIVIPFEYDELSASGWLVTVSKGKLVGVFNNKGNQLVAPKYDFVQDITPEIFYAKLGSKAYLVNIKGEAREID